MIVSLCLVPRYFLSFETALIMEFVLRTLYKPFSFPRIYIFFFDAVFWPILFTNTFSITLKPFFWFSYQQCHDIYHILFHAVSLLLTHFYKCSLYFALFIFSFSLFLLWVISSNFSFRFKSRLFSIILHFFLLNKLAIIYSWQKNQRGGHTLSDKAAATVQKGIKFHLWPIHVFINAAKCY